METEDIKAADIVLPEGFSKEDLLASEYGAPLAEAAKEITEQNERLIARMANEDFSPVDELEYAGNGAHDYIHEFFETLARYEEGRIPGALLDEMAGTTEQLLSTLEMREDAPMEELDAARVAFRKAKILWARVLPMPRRTRRTYLKAVFGYEREIGAALERLHQAYVKRYVKRGKVTHAGHRRRDLSLPGAQQLADDRARVFQAISTLRRDKGMSTRKAIEWLRRNETWRMRLGKTSDETWRCYYSKRKKV